MPAMLKVDRTGCASRHTRVPRTPPMRVPVFEHDAELLANGADADVRRRSVMPRTRASRVAGGERAP